MEGTSREIATLGGGCFWCLEAAYEQIEGVERIVSGYAGGAMANPTYAQVCSGKTGHAEVVQVEFDNRVVSFRDILDIFFTIHDPTTLNRQGGDVGTQYRSVIFYHDEDQKKTAEKMIEELNSAGLWSGKIVTQLQPAPEFFPAEEYHQEYYRRNPYQGYCQAVIAPKLGKLRKQHFERLRKGARGGNPAEGQIMRPGEPRNPLEQGGIAD
jgi:peptide-methionine (S)-S-oxide reductase